MKISSQFINTPLKDYKVKVDWRSIMNYAAAINDDNPNYFNNESENSIVAHPRPNRVREIACNFSGMVYPDSNISIQVKKKKETGNSKEIFFEVYNHENKKAIRNGYILLKK